MIIRVINHRFSVITTVVIARWPCVLPVRRRGRDLVTGTRLLRAVPERAAHIKVEGVYKCREAPVTPSLHCAVVTPQRSAAVAWRPASEMC